MMQELDEDKRLLRLQAALLRKSALATMPDAAERIAGFAGVIKSQFPHKIVAAYWPIRSEIDPIPLVGALVAGNDSGDDGGDDGGAVKACLPVTPQEGQPLVFHEWAIGTPLVDGPYQTKEPAPSSPITIPDLILAPLLAFDAQCCRLGYGGGFYDRTLAALAKEGYDVPVVGIAFDESEVESVPTGPYDKVLSGILTPSGLRRPLDL